VRSFCEHIRLRCENGRRRRRGNERTGNGILRYRRPVRAEQVVFVAAGSGVLVARRMTVTMTWGHAAGRVGRITAFESARGRALSRAKKQRHDQQCRELIMRPHALSRS
jgi:hypothetical protein